MAFEFTILLIIQGILGLIGIEYALKRVKRMMEIDEIRDSQFPAFRRLDAGRWSRLKFYPGALLVMPLRFLTIMSLGILYTFIFA